MSHKVSAAEQFAAVESELVGISSWMYAHPELSLEEFETSASLVSSLTDHGFDVEYPAYGMETAFAARSGSTGPEVVICVEYDALPVVGHACGHNLIATAALGAGVALRGLTDELGFRLTLLGTPAEETRGGKIDLIEAGAFSEAVAALMVHPAPMDLVDPLELAIRPLAVTFHGKESHAAMAPEMGINALDAFVQAYVNVSTLRQTFLAGDRVHGVITEGGDAANIVPAVTRSLWYVRSETSNRADRLRARVVSCFEAAALATGCTVTIEEHEHQFESLSSDPLLVDLFVANSVALGRPMPRRAELAPVPGGSTDMGNVSHVVPAIQPHIGIDCGSIVNHQSEFAAHTLTAGGIGMMRDGALAMAGVVIDLAVGDLWDALGQSPG